MGSHCHLVGKDIISYQDGPGAAMLSLINVSVAHGVVAGQFWQSFHSPECRSLDNKLSPGLQTMQKAETCASIQGTCGAKTLSINGQFRFYT